MIKRPLPALFFVLLAILLASAPSHALAEIRSTNMWWLPDCVTLQGQKIDRLFIWITDLTLVVFAAVMFYMVYFLVKYRARRGVKAIYSHGNDRLEVIWTTIPAMIFIGIVIYSNLMWKDIFDESKIPKDALNVEIVAEQYGFNIVYPGADNILGQTDDKLISMSNKLGLVPDDPHNKEGFTTYNEFYIPVDRAIHLHLRSRDVIHAFFVPEFRLGQDMVPGRTISYMWFQATRTGNFAICCNQLCGAGHYNMQAKLKVLSKEDYDKWYQSKLAAATSAQAAQNNDTSSLPVATTSTAGTAANGAALVKN